MKKWLAIGACVAVGVAAFNAPPLVSAHTQGDGHKAQMESNYLEESFSATGARGSGYVIHSWAQIDGNFDGMNQIEKIVGDAAQELSIHHAKVFRRSGDHERYYELTGSRSRGATAAIIFSSLQYPNGTAQSLMVIREDASSYRPKQLSNDLAQVSETAGNWAKQPVISACIEGSMDGRMSDAEQNRTIQRVFSRVGATRVEGIETGDLTSISAYSPLGPNNIHTNGRKMNLQVGLHYDDVGHVTNVVVGTPIITVTY